MRLIFLSCCIMLSACTGAGEEGRRSKAEVRSMLGKASAREWQLVQWYDPYNEGYTVMSDTAYPRYLIFFNDGGFIQYQGSNYSDGEWVLAADNQKMALVYHIQNGTRMTASRRDTSFRYQILQQTEDTLKLGIRGRHGLVEYTYLPARRSILPSSSPKP